MAEYSAGSIKVVHEELETQTTEDVPEAVDEEGIIIDRQGDEGEAETIQDENNYEPVNTDDELVCQPCKDDGKTLPAEGFCVTCGEHLCEVCFKHHTIPRPSRNHVLQDKNEMPKTLRTNYPHLNPPHVCTIHNNALIVSFCRDHKALCCERCVALSHQLCDGVKYIDVDYENVKSSDKFQRFLETINKLHAGYAKTRSTAVQNMKEIDWYHEQAMLAFKRYIGKMRQTDEEHITQILDVCDKVLLQLSDIRKGVNSPQDVHNNRDLFIKMVSFEGNEHFIETNLNSLVTRNQFQRYCFRPVGDHSLYGQVYKVSVCDDTLDHKETICNQLVLVSNKHLFIVGPDSIVCMDCNTKKQVENRRLNYVGSAVVKYVGEEVFIIQSRSLSTVNSTESFGRAFGFGTSKTHAANMPQSFFGTPVITGFGFDLRSSSLYAYTDVFTEKTYNPIIYNGKFHFAFCHDELEVVKVDELDTNGKLQRNISTDLAAMTANGNDYIKHPANAVYDDKDDVIYVTDSAMNSVFKMTTEGESHCIVVSERLACPADIAMCRDGTLMVCCTKSKSVVKVTKDGQIYSFIGPLEFEPKALAYSEENNLLYVGGKCKDIHIFFA